jgi:hypothetical protein
MRVESKERGDKKGEEVKKNGTEKQKREKRRDVRSKQSVDTAFRHCHSFYPLPLPLSTTSTDPNTDTTSYTTIITTDYYQHTNPTS